ncbi:MAG: DUF3347 domain-containing protein [Flavobacterium sp.]
MKTVSIKLMMTALLAITVNANAQIRNAKTELITVYGNCGMCENTIESAGNLKKIAKVDWDKDSKIATITYDSAKTDKNEILKRIALAGYDSDSFLAPDDVYNNLHGCCQYDRTAKIATTSTESKPDHSTHVQTKDMTAVKQSELQMVYANYFALKDALVSSNSALTTTKASALSASIKKVEMDKLDMDVHMVWMKVVENIKADSKSISATNDLEKQRKIFANLSNEIYSLMKVSKFDNAVYYQYCPMANGGKGANWLSKENEVRNPYYGSAMMTCGKTVETIK